MFKYPFLSSGAFIIVPARQTMLMFLVCFAPMGFCLDNMFEGPSPDPGFLDFALAVVPGLGGAIYFPMAFLSVTMHDTIMAANPITVIPALLGWAILLYVQMVLMQMLGLYYLTHRKSIGWF